MSARKPRGNGASPPISSTRRPTVSDGTRDPARTRRNLLDAAYREFSTSGFHGASIEKICRRAGVSKQVLSHHFGAKAEVYLTVLERAYQATRVNDVDLDTDAVDPVQAMLRFVGTAFDNVRNDRAFVRLLADENINAGRNIRRSTTLRDLYVPLIQRLGRILARGEQAGLFRPGLDPIQLYISISGLCFFYFSNAYTLSAVLAEDLLTKEAIAQRREHVLAFAMAAILRADPPLGSGAIAAASLLEEPLP